ncbi:MAG: radical SAM protein, partial [Verrucomicrobiota bacterium]
MNTNLPPGAHTAFHGRGAAVNPPNRFERIVIEPDPDADIDPEERVSPRTQFFFDASESVISKNDSPD